jgi:23S rRNA pseudouridine2605 synthase
VKEKKPSRRRPGEVSLERALSKLGIASRSQARALVLAGRVRIAGERVLDPGRPVVPEGLAIAIDGAPVGEPPRRTLLFHKPRGVMTTRSDEQGRRTVYDCIGEEATGLGPVGRLDLASTGLLLFTNDTRLADWLTDPAHAVERVYLVTVRGAVTEETATGLERGILCEGELLAAKSAIVRKRSNRESHLVLTLVEGRNREIRRLLIAAGHEVTRLKRVSYGGLTLGELQPGEWRVVSAAELVAAFPSAPVKGVEAAAR